MRSPPVCDGLLEVWSTTGDLLTTLTELPKNMWAEFSSDGQHIIANFRDKEIRVWSLDGKMLTDPEQRSFFNAHRPSISLDITNKIVPVRDEDNTILTVLSGHAQAITWAKINPDQDIIATASMDGTVRLWSIDGTPLATFSDHSGPVRSLMFSQDGSRILTASQDGTARQYLVNIEDLLAIAACRVSRNLTNEEMERFSINERYFVFEERQCPPVFSWEQ